MSDHHGILVEVKCFSLGVGDSFKSCHLDLVGHERVMVAIDDRSMDDESHTASDFAPHENAHQIHAGKI